MVLLIGILSACSNKSEEPATRVTASPNSQNQTVAPSELPASQPPADNAQLLTVASLEERGARKLMSNDILALIVDHSIVFQNLGTGEYFEAIYLKNGLRLLTSIDSGSLEGETLQDEYVVNNDTLQTEFQGNRLTTTVYQLDQRYLAAVESDHGVVNYEIRDIQKAPFTAQVLKAQNARILSTEEIKQLFIGKTMLIKDLESGDQYHGWYGEDGMRTLQYVDPTATAGESAVEKTHDPYRIVENKLHSMVDGNEIASMIFELESHYYGALSFDEGAVNYEFLPQ